MNPLALFAGPFAPLARLGLIALAGFGIWLHGWYKGNEHGGQKLIDYQAAEARADTKLAVARERVVREVEIKYRDRITEVRVAGETIEREVPIYVTKADDAGCTVPVGWVREYNAAWAGTPAGDPQDTDRGPSGYPLSEIAAAEAHNATSCRTWKAQRDGLIELYNRQRALAPPP